MVLNTPSIGGARYALLITDDYSRMTFCYPLARKAATLQRFVDFVKMATAFHEKDIKTLRMDNGGEFTAGAFKDFLHAKGIQAQFSVPYTPQQNGVAERKNYTVADSMRAQLAGAQAPPAFWMEALNTAVYIRNRLPTTALGERTTPFELWTGRRPNLKHFRTFGCAALVLNMAFKRKLDPRRKEDVHILLGYSAEHRGYRLWNPSRKAAVVARDVQFFEDVYPFAKKENGVIKSSDLHAVDSAEDDIPALIDSNNDDESGDEYMVGDNNVEEYMVDNNNVEDEGDNNIRPNDHGEELQEEHVVNAGEEDDDEDSSIAQRVQGRRHREPSAANLRQFESAYVTLTEPTSYHEAMNCSETSGRRPWSRR